MDVLGYELNHEIEEVMISRGIKLVDIQRLLESEAAAHFYSEDRCFGIIKSYLGMNTYYIEYTIKDGRKVITDTYCHWITLRSDLR